LLADVLWKQRALDVWVQVALIFSGVMGVLGLLSEKTHQQETHIHETHAMGEELEIAMNCHGLREQTKIQIEQELHV
jgi:hypothetical protein